MAEGLGLAVPRLMTHRGEGLGGRMNEGGEECRARIGAQMDRKVKLPLYSFPLQQEGKHGGVNQELWEQLC